MLSLSPARLSIYQVLLRLNEFLLHVGCLTLSLDKLLTILAKHLSLSVQLLSRVYCFSFFGLGQLYCFI